MKKPTRGSVASNDRPTRSRELQNSGRIRVHRRSFRGPPLRQGTLEFGVEQEKTEATETSFSLDSVAFCSKSSAALTLRHATLPKMAW